MTLSFSPTSYEIRLFKSLLLQLHDLYKPCIATEIEKILESTTTSGAISECDLNRLLDLLPLYEATCSEKRCIEISTDVSNIWDEVVSENNDKQSKDLQRINQNAAGRAHQQMAVYNKNLPTKCINILNRFLIGNKQQKNTRRNRL